MLPAELKDVNREFFDEIFEEIHNVDIDDQKTAINLLHAKRDFIGMNPQVAQDINELQFNSTFESGNLDMVVKHCPHAITTNTFNSGFQRFSKSMPVYLMFLRIDTNTRGYCNWFHFSVGRTRRNQTVRF